MGEDLPVETIIIVGCICGFIVVALSLVLAVLCYKKHKMTRHYQKTMTSSQHVSSSNGPDLVPKKSVEFSTNVPVPPKRTDSLTTDPADVNLKFKAERNGVFATETSKLINGGPMTANCHLAVNGGILPSYHYDNQRNSMHELRKNKLTKDEDTNLKRKSDSQVCNKVNGHVGAPPKKIIHEVIV